MYSTTTYTAAIGGRCNYITALHFTTIKPYLVGHNLNKMSKKQVLVGICLLDKLANTHTTKAKSQGANQFNRVVGKWRGCRGGNISPPRFCVYRWGFTQKFLGNQDVTVRLKSELIFI